MQEDNRIFVALDVSDIGDAVSIVETLSPFAGGFQITMQLMDSIVSPESVSNTAQEKIDHLLSLLECNLRLPVCPQMTKSGPASLCLPRHPSRRTREANRLWL